MPWHFHFNRTLLNSESGAVGADQRIRPLGNTDNIVFATPRKCQMRASVCAQPLPSHLRGGAQGWGVVSARCGVHATPHLQCLRPCQSRASVCAQPLPSHLRGGVQGWGIVSARWGVRTTPHLQCLRHRADTLIRLYNCLTPKTPKLLDIQIRIEQPLIPALSATILCLLNNYPSFSRTKAAVWPK